MEPFLDGGLFELLIAIGVGYTFNFIFKRKYLLILYSLISIIVPVLLLFAKMSEVFIWLVGICIFNAVFLIFLLWKQRLSEPGKSLIETDKYVGMYIQGRQIVKRMFKIKARTN